MKKLDFEAKIREYSGMAPVDARFLEKWFQGTIRKLKGLHEQQSGIAHPRHRGDAREDSFSSIIGDLIPPGITISKGYAVNRFSTRSNEQDILFLDGRSSSCLVKSGSIGHYPIESVLASVEVKSFLSNSELRKSILNCASLKRVTNNLTTEREKDRLNILYSIFAFKAAKEIGDVAIHINKLCEKTPLHLRPNAVYILGEGALIPSDDGNFRMAPSQFFESAKFSVLRGMGTKRIPLSEAYAFLYFLCGTIDHCTEESQQRKLPSLMSYFSSPLFLQQTLGAVLDEKDNSK